MISRFSLARSDPERAVADVQRRRRSPRPAAPARSKPGWRISRRKPPPRASRHPPSQAGLTGVTLDKSVLARDQSQKVFSQTFEEFSGRMVPPRLTRGANMLKQYGSVLGRIEQTYGVPGEVLVAIWGLETDFGVNIGKFPTLRSLATLAYDCRRTDMFKAELMDALRIVERGDIAPQDLRGAWAGEIGQTQFMPSSYIKFAVDFDGNGRRDLLRSAPGRAGLDRQLPRQPRLAARQGLGARRRQFRGDQGMEQERGLRQDDRLFRDAAFAGALAYRHNSKGRPQATGPLSCSVYFAVPACIALLRCAAQAPVLPLSIASWAAAISFWAAIFPSPSAMFSIIVSVLLRLSPLQPALTRAASAGETANAKAAIAVAASNLLSMVIPFCFWTDDVHCRLQRRLFV